MTDSLNEIAKTIRKQNEKTDDALKRLHKKRVRIERVTDTFDPSQSFKMDFYMHKPQNTVLIDLYFKSPVLTSCCAGDYCSACEIFTAGEEFLQLQHAYIPNSVTVTVNGRPTSLFTETSPTAGTVTMNIAIPLGAKVRVCYIMTSQLGG